MKRVNILCSFFTGMFSSSAASFVTLAVICRNVKLVIPGIVMAVICGIIVYNTKGWKGRKMNVSGSWRSNKTLCLLHFFVKFLIKLLQIIKIAIYFNKFGWFLCQSSKEPMASCKCLRRWHQKSRLIITCLFLLPI